jgi:hypothetical protein
MAFLVGGVALPLVAPAHQSQATELLLFIVFALAWDLVGGQMGYNSFGNVLFVGLGMYVSAIVQVGLFYNVGLYTEARGAAPSSCSTRRSSSPGSRSVCRRQRRRVRSQRGCSARSCSPCAGIISPSARLG